MSLFGSVLHALCCPLCPWPSLAYVPLCCLYFRYFHCLAILFCVAPVVWMTVAVLGMLVHMMIEVVDVRVRIELTKAIFSLHRQLFDFC